MNVEKVSREDWIIGGLAILLIIDLVFLPWIDLGVSGPICSLLSCTSTATGDPDGWLGVLAVLTLILLIVDLAVDRFSPQTTLPSINGSRTHTRFVLACVAGAFLALKFLFHINFGIFGFGFWAAVVLTIPLVYVTLQARNSDLGIGRRV